MFCELSLIFFFHKYIETMNFDELSCILILFTFYSLINFGFDLYKILTLQLKIEKIVTIYY